jgi:hypothetical protein
MVGVILILTGTLVVTIIYRKDLMNYFNKTLQTT